MEEDNFIAQYIMEDEVKAAACGSSIQHALDNLSETMRDEHEA